MADPSQLLSDIICLGDLERRILGYPDDINEYMELMKKVRAAGSPYPYLRLVDIKAQEEQLEAGGPGFVNENWERYCVLLQLEGVLQDVCFGVKEV